MWLWVNKLTRDRVVILKGPSMVMTTRTISAGPALRITAPMATHGGRWTLATPSSYIVCPSSTGTTAAVCKTIKPIFLQLSRLH